MPGFDRTGPAGQGSRTGRQMGKCGSRKNQPSNEQENPERPGSAKGKGSRSGNGRGLGLGRRLGRGNQ